MCSVSPDTILKWIRSGRLKARRTAGGHHRIAEPDLLLLMGGQDLTAGIERPAQREVRYCWEYNSQGALKEGCRDCAVYHMRALRCYEVIKHAPEALHARVFCEGSCADCDYYRTVHQQRTNVLVVTDDGVLADSLRIKADTAGFNLQVASCEYDTSAMVDRFRPDYAVVDCSLGEQKTRDICQHLLSDPRVPFVRLVLAARDGEFPAACDDMVFARIHRPFGIVDLDACILGTGEHRPEGA